MLLSDSNADSYKSQSDLVLQAGGAHTSLFGAMESPWFHVQHNLVSSCEKPSGMKGTQMTASFAQSTSQENHRTQGSPGLRPS